MKGTTIGHMVFGGMGLMDAGSRAKQAYKAPNLKMNSLLGNKKLVKDEFGGIQKVNDGIDLSASSAIEEMYIEKSSNYKYVPDQMDRDLRNDSDVYFQRDYHNSGRGKNEDKSHLPASLAAVLGAAIIANGIAKKNAIEPFREIGRGAKHFLYEYPKVLLGKWRAGKVAYKGFKKAQREVGKKEGTREFTKSNTGTFLKGLGVGAGLGTGNLAVHMIGDRYFDNKKNVVKKSYDAIQEPTSEVYHQRQRSRNQPDKYRDNRRKHSNGYNNRHNNRRDNRYDNRHGKSASEFIDGAFEKLAAPATFSGPKHYFKKVLREDVAQNALRSLPYFLAPLGAGMLIKRDLKYDLGKLDKNDNGDKIVIDVPDEALKKTAARRYQRTAGKIPVKPNLYESMPWKHFFKYDMPSSTVKALTWTVPIAALTAMTGRNLRNRGEKINDPGNTPVEPGKTRITIQTRGNSAMPDIDPRMASDFIDGMYKEAIAVDVKKNERT